MVYIRDTICISPDGYIKPYQNTKVFKIDFTTFVLAKLKLVFNGKNIKHFTEVHENAIKKELKRN